MQSDARAHLIQPNASIATAVHSPIVLSFAIACVPRSRSCCAGFQRRKNCSFGPFRAYMPSCRRYPNFPLFIFSFPPFFLSSRFFPVFSSPLPPLFLPIPSLTLLLSFTFHLLLLLPFHLSSLRVLLLFSHPVLAVAWWLSRPTAVWEDQRSNLAVDGCVYRECHCDMQPWARAAHLCCST